jgi:hypothetical protein
MILRGAWIASCVSHRPSIEEMHMGPCTPLSDSSTSHIISFRSGQSSYGCSSAMYSSSQRGYSKVTGSGDSLYASGFVALSAW